MSEDVSQSQSTTKRKICPKCDYEDRAGLLVCPFDGVSLVTQGKDQFIGQTIEEKYEILSLLGRGGMSVVYKAKHLMMNRSVAVKMLRPELVAVPQLLERFKIETNAVASLKHNSIVTVFDYGLLPNGTPYLIMDYLEGEPLNDILKACKRMEPDRAIPLFAQACDALAHAHDTGVIHRDIKPGNLLVRKGKNGVETLTIFDFGIAKVLGQDGSTIHKLTTSGEVFGSPLYMSPEQCSGDRIGTASDTYSLACVFYEALSGKPPLAGASPMDTLMKHINEDPEPFKPGLNIPPKLELAIMTALNKAPEDRQPHIKQFRDEILEAGGLKFVPGLQNTLEKTIQPQAIAIPENKVIERAGDASGVGNAYQSQGYASKTSTGYKKSAPAGGAAAGAPPKPKASPVTAIAAVVVAVLLIGGVGFLAYQKFQTQVIIVPDSETGSGQGTKDTDTKGGDTASTDTKTGGEDSSTADDGTSESSGDGKDGDTDSTKVASTDGTDSSGTDSSSTGADTASDGTDSSKSGGTDSSSSGTDTSSKTDSSGDGSKQGDGTTGSEATTSDTAPITVAPKHLGTDEMLELSQDPTFNLKGKLIDAKPGALLAAPKAGAFDKCEIIPFVLEPKTATPKQAADSVYKQFFEKNATWKSTALTVNTKFKDVVIQEISFKDNPNVKEYIAYVKNDKPEFLLGCQFVPKNVTEKELHAMINEVIPKLHSLLAK